MLHLVVRAPGSYVATRWRSSTMPRNSFGAEVYDTNEAHAQQIDAKTGTHISYKTWMKLTVF
jgi:hypothetical protein